MIGEGYDGLDLDCMMMLSGHGVFSFGVGGLPVNVAPLRGLVVILLAIQIIRSVNIHWN